MGAAVKPSVTGRADAMAAYGAQERLDGTRTTDHRALSSDGLLMTTLSREEV